eukprot:TRINITY_DN25071_c0_g1_i2.p1 TRINITY_DN25071_c0_g1~~TRINITY_DN25071_c0_g1_i2.p1  ORF type:complete len:1613 (+),score=308.04 TRINITY_DN25071_c0_g1_i2:121-4959(+)
MQSKISFALTTLDVRSESRVAALDDAFLPAWKTSPPGRVPVVRLFGVSRDGTTVCAHVHGFLPHFYAELSQDACSAIAGPPNQGSHAAPSIAAPSRLAAILEAALSRARPTSSYGSRVVGLRIENWKSAYGFQLETSPFLRVDLADPRDVGPLAAAIQRGDVPILGAAQAHEALTPYLMQVLAAHHLKGAGHVTVLGTLRDIGQEQDLGTSGVGLQRHSSCGVELDVISQEGFPYCAKLAELLHRVGPSPEARSRAYLRAMLDRQVDIMSLLESGAMADNGEMPAAATNCAALAQLVSVAAEAAGGQQRPGSAEKTTPMSMRAAIQEWLLGGRPLGPAAVEAERFTIHAAKEKAAQAAARREEAAQGALEAKSVQAATACPMDIEDLETPPSASLQASRELGLQRGVSRPPPIYSNPADDPRSGGLGTRPAPRSVELQSGDDARKSWERRPYGQASPGEPSPAAPSKSSTAPASAGQGTEGSTAEAMPDAEWEDLCILLSMELLCAPAKGFCEQQGGDKRGVMGQHVPPPESIVAVAFVVREAGIQGLSRFVRGAVVVAGADVAELRADSADLGELVVVPHEGALIETFAAIVRRIDPDMCLGWNLHNGSWGRLLSRSGSIDFASHADYCSSGARRQGSAPGRGGFDLRAALSRVPFDASAHFHSSGGLHDDGAPAGSIRNNNESEYISPLDMQMPGRLLINVWRLLMHTTFGTKLRSYAPQDAVQELFGRTLPLINLGDLQGLWGSGQPENCRSVIAHLQKQAALSIEVAESLSFLARAGEISRVTGMDIMSSITRGTQIQVESLLLRVAHAAGYLILSSSQTQVRNMPALECLPLVMEPESGYYWDPVLVMDFKSMYPSLIIGHNISFDTCLGRAGRTSEGPNYQIGVRDAAVKLQPQAALEALVSRAADTQDDPTRDCPVRMLPSGVLFASQKVQSGLMPIMLTEVLRLRAEAKTQLKAAMKAGAASTSPACRRLDGRQFALKYLANVTYGYSGASFSGRMPCPEVADAIVGTGRRALEQAADYIEAAVAGARVVYGDTDSVFVHMPGATLEEAFAAGRQICKEICAQHPAPVELEFEKVYMPSLLLTKKRYSGLAYSKPPSEGGKGEFEAKGIEAVRRDNCRFSSVVQRQVLEELFRCPDLSPIRRRFEFLAGEILRGGRHGPPLTDLVFHRIVRFGSYKAEGDNANSLALLPPQAAVARRRMAALAEQGEGDVECPTYGERVAYAVVRGPPGSRLIDKCAAEADRRKNLLASPVLQGVDSSGGLCDKDAKDLRGLPPIDVNTWLHTVPRPAESKVAAAAASAGCRTGLSTFLRRVCKLCGKPGAARGAAVCGSCATVEVRMAADAEAKSTEAAADALRQRCQACAGTVLWRKCCAAAYCPVIAQRVLAEEEAKQAAHAAAIINDCTPTEESSIRAAASSHLLRGGFVVDCDDDDSAVAEDGVGSKGAGAVPGTSSGTELDRRKRPTEAAASSGSRKTGRPSKPCKESSADVEILSDSEEPAGGNEKASGLAAAGSMQRPGEKNEDNQVHRDGSPGRACSGGEVDRTSPKRQGLASSRKRGLAAAGPEPPERGRLEHFFAPTRPRHEGLMHDLYTVAQFDISDDEEVA